MSLEIRCYIKEKHERMDAMTIEIGADDAVCHFRYTPPCPINGKRLVLNIVGPIDGQHSCGIERKDFECWCNTDLCNDPEQILQQANSTLEGETDGKRYEDCLKLIVLSTKETTTERTTKKKTTTSTTTQKSTTTTTTTTSKTTTKLTTAPSTVEGQMGDLGQISDIEPSGNQNKKKKERQTTDPKHANVGLMMVIIAVLSVIVLILAAIVAVIVVKTRRSKRKKEPCKKMAKSNETT